ncbi:MAG: SRPBCC family protein [Candidatus Acidiferrales bacterium]
MASICKEILVEAHPDDVWAAVRDFGMVHRRLAVGFVADTRLDGDARIVTFANGLVVRELLIDLDDDARRVVYSIVQGKPTHHNASMQVFAAGDGRTRLVWITDLLPNEAAEPFRSMIEQGAAAMKQALEGRMARGQANLAEESRAR